MSKLLPDWFIGSLLGFALSVFLWIGIAHESGIAVERGRYLSLAVSCIGTLVGGVLGVFRRRPAQEGGMVARWAIGTAAVLGSISFLGGFVGPIVVRPDLPQGPLLGIFITGPLGTTAGLVIGLVIGLVLQRQRLQRSSAA